MEKIIIKRTTDIKDARAIHNVLYEAFEPYRPQYTTEALNATVVITEKLEKRIADPESVVLIAVYDNEIAGTVSLLNTDENNIYIASMAVKPEYHGKGVGSMLLKKTDKIASEKQCQKLILETSAPLIDAIRLYEKFGYERTGRTTDYYGVTIFEMVKEVV